MKKSLSNIIYIIFFSIIFFSCVSIKIGENSKKENLKNDNIKFNTKIKDIANKLIEMGLSKSLKDFDGFIWGFTVIDSLNNPVPFANILIDNGNNEIIKISKSDENGQFKLSFSLPAIEKNPLIYAEYSGKYYGVEWKMTAETDTEKGLNSAKSINLSDLKIFTTKDKDILYLSVDLQEKTEKYGINLMEKQRQFIEEFTGLDAIPFGIAIINHTPPITVTPDETIIEGITIKVFPYSYNPSKKLSLSNTNIHEWTEQTLIKNLGRIPRLLSDGISTYVEFPFYKSLSQ